MKTITEFAVVTLKNAAKTKQDLVAGGKTPEELPAALGEALKLEGDKLNHMLAAIEAVEAKLNDLKRVVVATLAEGEKAPSGAQEKNGSYYIAEYFPAPMGKGAAPGKDAHGRGDKRGGRGDKRGGRGGKEGDRGGRGPGGPGRGGPGGERAAGGGGGRGPGAGRGPGGAGAGGPPRLPQPNKVNDGAAAKPAEKSSEQS